MLARKALLYYFPLLDRKRMCVILSVFKLPSDGERMFKERLIKDIKDINGINHRRRHLRGHISRIHLSVVNFHPDFDAPFNRA